MANRSSIKANEEELKAYFADLAAQNLWPLWTLNQSREPKSKATPYIWHWRDLRPLAMRAAELVGTKEAERRVLVLSNPGTQWGAANTLVRQHSGGAARRSRPVPSSYQCRASLHYRRQDRLYRRRWPALSYGAWRSCDHTELELARPRERIGRSHALARQLGCTSGAFAGSWIPRGLSRRDSAAWRGQRQLAGKVQQRRSASCVGACAVDASYTHVSLPTGAGQSGAGSARCRRSGITLRRDHLGVHKPHYGRTCDAHHWLLHPATAPGRAHRVPSSHLVRLLPRGRGLRLHGDRRPATGLGGKGRFFRACLGVSRAREQQRPPGHRFQRDGHSSKASAGLLSRAGVPDREVITFLSSCWKRGRTSLSMPKGVKRAGHLSVPGLNISLTSFLRPIAKSGG